MLNRAPIIINGLTRGGTNLLMNLIASHPDVCLLSDETQDIFYGKSDMNRRERRLRRLLYSPVRRIARQHFFHPKCFEVRNELPVFMRYYLDALFYLDKITSKKNAFKADGVPYSAHERRASRFLAKNLNGLVMTADFLSKVYADATFISIIRDGLAFCEGRVRRNRSAADAGKIYAAVCQQMIRDAGRIPNYHIVRFEDMVADPIGFMKTIYTYAGLDINKVSKIRLQAKRSVDKDGSHAYTFADTEDRAVHWVNIDEIGKFIRKDVNENQIKRLRPEDRTAFLAHAEESMKHFGYL